MSKYDDTRQVIFKEDYAPQTDAAKKSGKKAKVIYQKGSTHFIHKNLVKRLQDRGGKFEVKDVNFKHLEEKAKLEREKVKK